MAERKAWATPAEVSEWLQLGANGERKLRDMRRDGTGPKFARFGRDVRYAWLDVHAWCAELRTNGAS